HGVRVRRADRDRHRQPDPPAHRRIRAVRGVEVEQRRRTAGYGPLSGRRPKRARVRLRVIDQPSRQAASVCPQCGTHIAPPLLGLTKASTLFTMLLSAGVYWAAWGWKFALGVVLSIYVHEMGHVQALQRYGIKATAPMFIPGVGAVVRLKQYPASPRDARVGL